MSDDAIKGYIRDCIDQAQNKCQSLSSFIKIMLTNDIIVTPATLNSETKAFNTCRYVFGDYSFTGTELGSSYTAGSLMKRGITYDADTEYPLVAAIYAQQVAARQAGTISGVSMSTECKDVLLGAIERNHPVRVNQEVVIQASIDSADCSFTFEPMTSDNKWSNLEIFSEKRLRLRAISWSDERRLDICYENAYSLSPWGVSSNEKISNVSEHNLWGVITDMTGLDMDKYLSVDFEFEMPIATRHFYDAITDELLFTDVCYDIEYKIEKTQITTKIKGL